MWMNRMLLGLLIASIGGGGPESDLGPYLSEASLVLENCDWSSVSTDDKQPLERGMRRRIELVVLHFGKTVVYEKFNGEVTATSVVVHGNPYEAMAKRLLNHGAEGACDAIPTTVRQTDAVEVPRLKSLVEELDSIPAFDFEDAIVIHEPVLKIRIVGWNLKYSAEWFDGDPSALGEWAEKLLALTAPGLKSSETHDSANG